MSEGATDRRRKSEEVGPVPFVQVERVAIAHPDAQRLIAATNAELGALYPEPGATHWSLTHEETSPGRGGFFVARLDGRAVASGAVRLLDPQTAEVKRMYVEPAHRRAGLARAILAAIESEARALGATRLVLESGVRSTPAIALYEREGFTRIPACGEYVLSPKTSVCMAKAL